MKQTLIVGASVSAALATALFVQGNYIYAAVPLYCAGALAVGAFFTTTSRRGLFPGWMCFTAAVGGALLGNAGHQAAYDLRSTGDITVHYSCLAIVLPLFVAPALLLLGILPAATSAFLMGRSNASSLERFHPYLNAAGIFIFLTAASLGASTWTAWQPDTSGCF